MFKLIIFIGLIYFAYRLFVGPPLLSEWKGDQLQDQEPDDGDYADFEELDD